MRVRDCDVKASFKIVFGIEYRSLALLLLLLLLLLSLSLSLAVLVLARLSLFLHLTRFLIHTHAAILNCRGGSCIVVSGIVLVAVFIVAIVIAKVIFVLVLVLVVFVCFVARRLPVRSPLFVVFVFVENIEWTLHVVRGHFGRVRHIRIRQ